MNYIIIEVKTQYSYYYIRALAIVRMGACYEIAFTQGTDVIYSINFDEDEILPAVNKNGLLQMNIGLKELGSVSFYSSKLWEDMKRDHDVKLADTFKESN